MLQSKKSQDFRYRLLLLSGYHSLPEEHHYWSRQQDLGVTIVSNTMSRNRYYEIKKYLHFADSQNLTEGDKVSKIAPLYEMLNQNLFQFGIFNKLLSVHDLWYLILVGTVPKAS